MYWIHGGGFSTGSDLMYAPYRYMEEDIVLVEVQYRLGPLGNANSLTFISVWNVFISFGLDKDSCHWIPMKYPATQVFSTKSKVYAGFKSTSGISGVILTVWLSSERVLGVSVSPYWLWPHKLKVSEIALRFKEEAEYNYSIFFYEFPSRTFPSGDWTKRIHINRMGLRSGACQTCAQSSWNSRLPFRTVQRACPLSA